MNVEWTSGARKETTVIKWKIHDFLALCELKELLRNETCVFRAGHTLNKPTRWCFNIQRMKNEDNIGLFLKRLPPLSFYDTVGYLNSTANIEKNPGADGTATGTPLLALPDVNEDSRRDEDADESVYIHYECVIKRSGHGDVWIHKRTCIPNFEVEQRLGFRKLFTMENLKAADDLLKPKTLPLLSDDNSLHLEIKFTLHLKTVERTRLEMNLVERFSLDRLKRQQAKLLQEELNCLFRNGLNADLILIMEADADPEEKTFFVHKGILATRSPVFSAMLHSGMREPSSGIVRIKDVTSKAMQSVLCYVYCGNIGDDLDWKDVRQVEELIYAADKYALAGLRDFCDKMMFTGCENTNAMELLYLAQMHGMKVAANEISVFIKMYTRKLT